MGDNRQAELLAARFPTLQAWRRAKAEHIVKLVDLRDSHARGLIEDVLDSTRPE